MSRHLIGRLVLFLNQPLFVSKSRALARPLGEGLPARGAPGGRSVQTPEFGALAAAVAAQRTAPMPMDSAPVPISLAQAPAAPPASTQAMRTLEEVRTDLARLREQTTRRREAARLAHLAHVQAIREAAAFAPTGLQGLGDAASPAAGAIEPPRRRPSVSGFMPTDFMGFPTRT